LKIDKLLAGTIALVLVTGMTGSAFAGDPFDCTISEGDMLTIQLPVNEQVTISKKVECNEQPIGITIGPQNCKAVGVDIIFDNSQFGLLDFTIDEKFTNVGLGNNQAQCTQPWTVFSVTGSQTNLLQELSFNGIIVGGELIPIETTSLLLVGAQSFSWMIPVVLSVLGIGLFVVSRKSE